MDVRKLILLTFYLEQPSGKLALGDVTMFLYTNCINPAQV
ncbi:hypothetical protein GA0116948_104251 [Chitinophaga costaii]|uniref:Uncharacterized protein n=1 Tax=Chitinophaga costaii TaxID=1335309 RepID=A0A1C4CR70_9BACT|nr:hypothetical protein GA0116948_104251 [Chitinophaga costaii]